MRSALSNEQDRAPSRANPFLGKSLIGAGCSHAGLNIGSVGAVVDPRVDSPLSRSGRDTAVPSDQRTAVLFSGGSSNCSSGLLDPKVSPLAAAEC